MDLYNLQAFLRVAGLLSFSKAADDLHISQSSITLRVQALEKELGQQLFIRSSRKVELSPVGTELLPYVEQALHLLELGKNKVENNGVLPTRRLTIASIPTINFHEIPMLGESIQVTPGVITGLPVPAGSEIVLEGECLPSDNLPEGPFGEWTGYYTGGREDAQVFRVKGMMHRKDPIVVGCSQLAGETNMKLCITELFCVPL